MRIDAHAHLYPERFLDLIERQGDKHPVEVRRAGAGGERKLIVAGREFFTFLPDFFDLDVRLEQMAAAAVDMQVLSLGPPMVYWAEPELGAELCRAFNDEIASIVRRHPDKFVALAAAPPQDVDAAIAEMGRAPLLKTLQTSFAWFGKNAAGEAKKMQYDKGFRITKYHVAPQFLEAALKKLGK